jgi:hypothetical protein
MIIVSGDKMERRLYLSFSSFQARPQINSPARSPGLLRESRAESAVEQGAQSLRDRFVENVIVEGVKEAFPIGPAGNKIADLTIDRRFCDLGFDRKAVLGEGHGVVFLPWLESSLCHILRWCGPSGHRMSHLMSDCQQFVTLVRPMPESNSAMQTCMEPRVGLHPASRVTDERRDEPLRGHWIGG